MCAGVEGDSSPGPWPFPRSVAQAGDLPAQSHVSRERGTEGGHGPGTLLCTAQAPSSLALSRACTSTGLIAVGTRLL